MKIPKGWRERRCKAAHVPGWSNDDEKILEPRHLWSICILVIYPPTTGKNVRTAQNAWWSSWGEASLASEDPSAPEPLFPIAYSMACMKMLMKLISRGRVRAYVAMCEMQIPGRTGLHISLNIRHRSKREKTYLPPKEQELNLKWIIMAPDGVVWVKASYWCCYRRNKMLKNSLIAVWP